MMNLLQFRLKKPLKIFELLEEISLYKQKTIVMATRNPLIYKIFIELLKL